MPKYFVTNWFFQSIFLVEWIGFEFEDFALQLSITQGTRTYLWRIFKLFSLHVHSFPIDVGIIFFIPCSFLSSNRTLHEWYSLFKACSYFFFNTKINKFMTLKDSWLKKLNCDFTKGKYAHWHSQSVYSMRASEAGEACEADVRGMKWWTKHVRHARHEEPPT